MDTESLFLGAKRPECGFEHPPAPRAEIRERVGLYLHFSSGPSRYGTVTFSFPSLKKQIKYIEFVINSKLLRK
jgi:hypothetical protein